MEGARASQNIKAIPVALQGSRAVVPITDAGVGARSPRWGFFSRGQGRGRDELLDRRDYARSMANPEHVAKLKQGVEAWNRWRKANPDLGADLKAGIASSPNPPE